MPRPALLLDFGGTLAAERTSRAAIYAEAARARGLAVANEAMARLMSGTLAALPREIDGSFRFGDAWFRRFIATIFRDRLGLAEAQLGAVEDELFGRFRDAATFRLRPGVHELLEGARERGHACAIVSNWGEHLEELVASLGLRDAFEAVLGSALERVEKPDPEIFRRALARLNVAAEDAIHVGDRWENDVVGARAAGVRPILYRPPPSRPFGTIEAEEDGVIVVPDLRAVLAHLRPPDDPSRPSPPRR